MSEELRKEFGNNIRRYRKAAGLSQEQLAEMIEIATTSLSLIETGKGFVTSSTLDKITKALKVTAAQLFTFVRDDDAPAMFEKIMDKILLYKDDKSKLLLLDAFLNAL